MYRPDCKDKEVKAEREDGVTRSMEENVLHRDDNTCVHCLKSDCDLFGCLILPSAPVCHLNGITLCRECRADTEGRRKLVQIDSDLRHTHSIWLRKRILKAEPDIERVSQSVDISIKKWGQAL